MNDLRKNEINNWKLKEISEFVTIIAKDSIRERNHLLKELKIPVDSDSGLYKSDTLINWLSMHKYYKFFFDSEGEEELNEQAFKNSLLSKKENVIITYGWKEPMVKIPTGIFIKDWEDFLASTQWETIIFSEDFELIMEVSRDYHLHSNFKIR
ncbi:MAG: hypothetical protein GKR88_14715 [Flavobacteriaceae bacterium]|nr:MAG: hypothetical protein GKR88_14715 [Flavobacteriaceae bacterium]